MSRSCIDGSVSSGGFVKRRTHPVVVLAIFAGTAVPGCSDGTNASATTTSSFAAAPTEVGPPNEHRPAGNDVASSTLGASLEWATCVDLESASGQCATLEVPIDYDDPIAGTLEVFVYRELAVGERRGTLIVNPGGPGASAVDFVRDRSGSFPEGFDVIGFDPRGVGRSHPVHCIDSSEIETMFSAPLRPADDAELDDWLDEAQQSADSCLATVVGAHIGTVNVARDLDRLRIALGEDAISYLGFSYGARLGWTYAALFPSHVRAMVLDGPEDPDADVATGIVQQAAEFEHLATEFNESCQDTTSFTCPDDIRTAASQIVRRAENSPIPTRTGKPDLSARYAINAVLSAFYDPRTWPDLSEALRVADTFDGLPLARLSYWWNENQDPRPDATIDPIDLIWCADHIERPTVDDYARITEQIAAVSPTFAAWFPGVVPRCYGHPPAAEPAPPPTDTASTPILVVASTGDFATPLAGAKHLVSMLGNAVLLTRDGSGHTSYGLGNSCIDRYVDVYLTELTLPAPSTTCTR
jgi:pimeloyl-ACP methyl ester carboxylesterase